MSEQLDHENNLLINKHFSKGCIVGTPGDILKIRLINDMNGTKYKGLRDAWSKAI